MDIRLQRDPSLVSAPCLRIRTRNWEVYLWLQRLTPFGWVPCYVRAPREW
jgi:hypothetical protein